MRRSGFAGSRDWKSLQVGSLMQLASLVVILGYVAAAGAANRDQKVRAAGFVAKAAQANQVELTLGRLAAQRAGDERIRQFGSRMVEDHEQVGRELAALAGTAGLALTAEPNEEQDRNRLALEQMAGPEFDRRYMKVMVQEHSRCVKQFEKAAFGLDNQELQHWAAGSLPMLNEHHHEARALASSLGSSRMQAR